MKVWVVQWVSESSNATTYSVDVFATGDLAADKYEEAVRLNGSDRVQMGRLEVIGSKDSVNG